MYRSRSTVRKVSNGAITSNKVSMNHCKGEKPSSDAIYLMQNQNQILKAKNSEVINKVDTLKIELQQRNYRISAAQKDCQMLRDAINQKYYTKDLQLESDRRMLQDRLKLTVEKVQIFQEKIKEARKVVVIEEEKIIQFIQDKKRYEQQLRLIAMDNESSKVTLKTLEDENQILRSYNAQAALKKFTYEPQEKSISLEIQDRIAFIKEVNNQLMILKKQQGAKMLHRIFLNLISSKDKINFIEIQRYGLRKSLIHKRFFQLAYIRGKYLDSIKNKALSAFKQKYKPFQEQGKCMQIIRNMSLRRQKAKIWRIWKNQTTKAEYVLIRKYECQNTLEKVCMTIMRTQLYSCFSQLKYHKNHHFSEKTCDKMFTTLSKIYKQKLNSFLTLLKAKNSSRLIELQIENSAKHHSQILGMGMVFGEWAKVAKTDKAMNHLCKYRYFKELKKLLALKKKRSLVETLGCISAKVNETNQMSICFSQMKKQYLQEKHITLNQEKDKYENRLKDILQSSSSLKQNDKASDQVLCLIKINNYLKKKTQQAFNIWRKQNRRVLGLRVIFQLLTNKQINNINFAFSQIQKERFSNLKLSIQDKIASCEYSYNYLLQENSHIKQVLQAKSHQLEKAKFTTILRRLMRREKEAKQHYFYKFLRNGFKCWKVRKSLERIDNIMTKKLKFILFFLLKLNRAQMIRQEKINYLTNKHDQNDNLDKYTNTFNELKSNAERNKRIKRVLMGIFQRNFELRLFQAFGKIRSITYQHELSQVKNHQSSIAQQTQQASKNITQAQQTLDILTTRLSSKQITLRERKTMSLYKFYQKNIKNYVGTYLWRWKDKVDQQKKILRFVQILDVKSQSAIKMKLLLALQKTKGQQQKIQLQKRLAKFKAQYEKNCQEFEKLKYQAQEKSTKYKSQNVQNIKLTAQYIQKTEHMNEVKVQSFVKQWRNHMFQLAFEQWKSQKNIFFAIWNHVEEMLKKKISKYAFQAFTYELKMEFNMRKRKMLLSKIARKNFVENAGMSFDMWRTLVATHNVNIHQDKLKQTMKGMQYIQNHHNQIKDRYLFEMDYHLNFVQMRKLTQSWKQYTLLKKHKREKQQKFNNWLRKGYSVEFIKTLKTNKNKQKDNKLKIQTSKHNAALSQAKNFIDKIKTFQYKKHIIQKLFIDKFCFYRIFLVKQQFFACLNNYSLFKEITHRDKLCYNIQRVIETFEKKRKDILCESMRIWRRNQYVRNIQIHLMRRVIKKALNNKYRDLFYAWKLQKEARSVSEQHTQQGQIKMRKMQIKRLRNFLDQYKKQKGLLLENQEGKFVVSPRFQQKKQQQSKRENILKYKFVSRLVLAMNGYHPPIKAWNNLQMYMRIRQQYKKAALMTKNRLQKPDLYDAFKIWRDGTRQIKQMFREMERKDLIKILNRLKDKMEIEYTKKLQIEQNVKTQLQRYKVLTNQEKHKQRICSQILMRQARKSKAYAFEIWRKRAEQIQQKQARELEENGSNKVMRMEDELFELQRYQKQISFHNQTLRQAVQEALEMAEMVKRISKQRDILRKQLFENDVSCQNLQEQNEQLNNKLVLAQKEAMNLLVLSGQQVV